MNHFLKKNKNWLGWMALALFIILMAFFFRPNSPEYKLNEVKTLQLMNDKSMAIAVSEIAGKQTIDIRTAEEFAHGHFENAINIPIRQLLDKESIKLLKQLKDDGSVAVLYGSHELEAVSPWLLLQQLGFKNILRLKGYINSENNLSATDLAAVETAMPDTSVFHTKDVQAVVPTTNSSATKPEVVKPIKRETTKSGGC